MMHHAASIESAESDDSQRTWRQLALAERFPEDHSDSEPEAPARAAAGQAVIADSEPEAAARAAAGQVVIAQPSTGLGPGLGLAWDVSSDDEAPAEADHVGPPPCFAPAAWPPGVEAATRVAAGPAPRTQRLPAQSGGRGGRRVRGRARAKGGG